MQEVKWLAIQNTNWLTLGPELELDNKTFTFHVFLKDDLSSWMPIPPTAITDDDIWRSLVPPTYGVLGFTLT
jgi:hypothetical protein